MKTTTTFAATLVVGMALTPMAATAATITFEAENITGDYVQEAFNFDSGSGSMVILAIRGQNTPRNANESRGCDFGCELSFQTGELLSSSSRYEFGEENSWPPAYIIDESKWKGGGFVEISERDPNDPTVTSTMLLTGIFAEPITAIRETAYLAARGGVNLKGILTNVVIDEDLAAYYGVPNRGTGEINIRGFGRYQLTNLSFEAYRGTVTFSPVPVPAALPLMLTALAGLGVIRLRRMQAA